MDENHGDTQTPGPGVTPPRGDLGSSGAASGAATPSTYLPPDPASWSQPVAPPRPQRKWLIVGGIASIVVLAIVLVSMLGGSGSAAVPDEFSGAEKVDGPMADFFDAFSEPFDELGIDVTFALYGSDFDPRYMIMLMEGEGVAGGGNFGQDIGTGMVGGMGAQIDLSEAIEETVGSAEYMCVPATGQQFSQLGGKIAMCIYLDGDQAGVVMAFRYEDLNGLMDKTQELHDQLVD